MHPLVLHLPSPATLQLVLDGVLGLCGLGLGSRLVALKRPAQRRGRDLELVLALFRLGDGQNGVGGAARQLDVDGALRAVPALGTVTVPLLGVVALRAALTLSVPAGKAAERVGRRVLVALLPCAAKEAQLVRVVTGHRVDAGAVELLPFALRTVMLLGRDLVQSGFNVTDARPGVGQGALGGPVLVASGSDVWASVLALSF